MILFIKISKFEFHCPLLAWVITHGPLQLFKNHFRHPHDGFEIKMTKITPPISCYLSAEGCYEVEHGLFLQCKKSASVKTMDSFVTLKSKTKSEEKKENKKINKYLISSEDDSDQDITPSKKLKSWSKTAKIRGSFIPYHFFKNDFWTRISLWTIDWRSWSYIERGKRFKTVRSAGYETSLGWNNW